MQEIHSIGGGGGGGGGMFLSSGGAGGGDRRLRPHHQNQQALKCPRCDSLNTKFCYYNNYNLSQPRHFCKNCRRYWTKGGVLRNVPVGGGCRKSKRSSKPSSSSAAAASSSSDLGNPKSDPSSSNSNSVPDTTHPLEQPTPTCTVVATDCGGIFSDISPFTTNDSSFSFTIPDASSFPWHRDVHEFTSFDQGLFDLPNTLDHAYYDNSTLFHLP
ncbi:hypothetical protein Fmac_012688 [Flemingia macrophylla]|uniref:Dof zinc finger protein n=1 Tax=Flemingia macrophylla TaxID=520843 RepID=A0ABD1MR04_9FABA